MDNEPQECTLIAVARLEALAKANAAPPMRGAKKGLGQPLPGRGYGERALPFSRRGEHGASDARGPRA